jgi:hypothetical protein
LKRKSAARSARPKKAARARQRGVEVLTAQEDGGDRLADPDLLDRATALGRVLFSPDDELLREATRRQQSGEPYPGLVYGHQLNVTVGHAIRDLELIAKVYESSDILNRVEFLPL